MLLIASALLLVAAPLLVWSAGLFNARRTPAGAASAPVLPWNGKLILLSALLYTLAFNLTFFIQELFLVLPKALTPGLQPTLFHNNHGWQGEHPLASLFQGTGALATALTGACCALLLSRRTGTRSTAGGLFLFWMAYSGLFMALPQVVIGALSTGSDVGMAMEYLRLGAGAKNAAALLALAVIPPFALWLGQRLLGVAENSAQIASPRARNRFVFQTATLPALMAVALIIPFRIPREPVEVVLLPVLVTVIGIAWIQAGAWRTTTTVAAGSRVGSLVYPLIAVLALLAVFQLLLRPGIRFY
ncbi:hypothetical protein SAMN06296416_104125 [Pseudoxanthomonas wuyuanensis]|uniref:Uncharacterized protein n=1 Tax=Pseudoxanthomonas wuyuanensis TaxID=1073196 RepID=A0A286D7A2_9GAMM|nr:hypothetical protein CSC75_08430 [Pseudoxanthomonas wuyuanensis]SOD54518.1 hypothetical protein SAMN06296416_104125 [Pseudoxanthomonas wuyuanensis]